MLLDTYQKCSPRYEYMPTCMNPKRNLTYPAEPMYNNGYDNSDFDYILRVNDYIVTPENKE